MKLNESSDEDKRRLAICHACPLHQKNRMFGVSFISCGKFPQGSEVVCNGVKVKLCGCVMRLKTMVSEAKCPINNW